MKVFLFSSAAALALAGAVGTVSAAALARRPPPPPPTKAPVFVPAYSWTGAYIGINGGFGFRPSEMDGLAGGPGKFPFKIGDGGGSVWSKQAICPILSTVGEASRAGGPPPA